MNVQQLSCRLHGEFARQRCKVGGRIGPAGLEQSADDIGDLLRIEHRFPAANAVWRFDWLAPKFDPVVAMIKNFEAQ